MARIVPVAGIETETVDLAESLSKTGDTDGRCATNEFMDHVDAHMADVTGNVSIFTLAWAARRVNCIVIVTMVLSIIGQVFVPLYVLVKGTMSPQFDEDDKLDESADSFLIRGAVIVLTAYLWSTLYGTTSRCLGMVFLMQAVPEWNWVLGLGVVTLHVSIVITACATFFLYTESPSVQNVLLNCVALNFIPDMDTALVVPVVAVDLQLNNSARRRLNKLAELWPRSRQRAQLDIWHRSSIKERFRTRPVLSLQLAEMLVLIGLALLALILTPAFI